jgi:hypothetical protein
VDTQPALDVMNGWRWVIAPCRLAGFPAAGAAGFPP